MALDAIGLHIVKTYTELLGGKVSVESKLNEGSKFSFTLTLKIPDKDAKPQNITPQSLTARSEEPPILIESAAINTNIAAALENAPEILVVEDNIILYLHMIKTTLWLCRTNGIRHIKVIGMSSCT